MYSADIGARKNEVVNENRVSVRHDINEASGGSELEGVCESTVVPSFSVSSTQKCELMMHFQIALNYIPVRKEGLRL
jgi:hypothetical protein